MNVKYFGTTIAMITDRMDGMGTMGFVSRTLSCLKVQSR